MSYKLTTATTIPRLPSPAGGFDEIYVNQLIAALEDTIEILNSTRQRNFTEISLTNTRGANSDLRVGDVYQDSGILRIVRADDVMAGSLAMSSSVGTVSVSTP